jgi:hypothetical protein
MHDESHDKVDSKQLNAADRDRVVQVLSLEYQTLRADILVRAQGRYQFLGLMTTAAALLISGAFGGSAFGGKTWIPITLAVGVFTFGLAPYLLLGRHSVRLRARVAEIEKRINALTPEHGSTALLSWESDRQQRGPLQELSQDILPRRIERYLRSRLQ